jgi:membrane protein DedA with SNARE-associated domain
MSKYQENNGIVVALIILMGMMLGTTIGYAIARWIL